MTEKKERFKDKYGNVYGDLMVTPTGRAAWVFLDNPSKMGPTPKYTITILFSKEDEKVINSLTPFLDIFDELLKEKYGAGNEIPAQELGALRDGDDPKVEKYKGFPDTFFMKASSTKPVDVFDAKKARIEPGMIQPGMLVKLVVTPMAANKGAAYQLKGVQLVKDDGVRYYGGPDPKSLFDVIEGEEEINGEAPEESTQETGGEPAPAQIAPQPENPQPAAASGKSPAQARLEATMAKRKASVPQVKSAPGIQKKNMSAALNKL